MIEAIMLWNEPNNKSHWDFEIDPEWRAYAEMVHNLAFLVQAAKAGLGSSPPETTLPKPA